MDIPQTYIENNKPNKPKLLHPGLWMQSSDGRTCFVVEDDDGYLLIIDSTDYSTTDYGYDSTDHIPNGYQPIQVESVVLKVK